MLLEAIESKDVRKVKDALRQTDIDQSLDESEITALTAASATGSPEIVRLILQQGANPNLGGEMGYPPLTYAILDETNSGKWFEISSMLLQAGAKPDGKNAEGEMVIETLLYAPSRKGNEEKALFLIRQMHQQNPDRDYSELGFLAIRYAWVSTLELLLELGLNLKARDRFGYTLLHTAVREGKTAKVEILLNAGADFEYKPKLDWDEHVFPFLCFKGRMETLEMLKKKGFDFLALPNRLQAAINQAIKGGKSMVLHFLEENGVDLIKTYGTEQASLLSAIEFDQETIFTMLMDKGADPEEKDNSGNSALLFAAYYGRTAMLKRLLQAGTNVNAQNELGWNALMQAAVNRNTNSAKLLIDAGIELDQAGEETGATALIIAASEGHGDIVQMLLEAGAAPSIHAKNGKTAQTSALANQHFLVAALFGNVKPHFSFRPSPAGETNCAYCGEKITSPEVIQDNFCPECDAHYCEKHFEWGPWQPPDSTATWEERQGSCPNAHPKTQEKT